MSSYSVFCFLLLGQCVAPGLVYCIPFKPVLKTEWLMSTWATPHNHIGELHQNYPYNTLGGQGMLLSPFYGWGAEAQRDSVQKCPFIWGAQFQTRAQPDFSEYF